MICADCIHGEMRSATDTERSKLLRSLARQGLMACGKTYCGATLFAAMTERQCATFESADSEVAATRRKWFAKQEQGRVAA